MAMHTTYCIVPLFRTVNHVTDQAFVALQTVFLQNPGILFFYHDRLGKVLERESLGVEITVFCFRDVFRDELVRKMTINTSCNGVMRTLLPGIKLWLHNVTILAGRWIFTKIRKSFRVLKGEASQPEPHSQ